MVKISVLSSGTCDEIVPLLKSGFLDNKIMCDIELLKYNQIYIDTLDFNNNFYKGPPEFVLLLLDEKTIIEKLPSPWSVSELNAITKEVLSTILTIIYNLRQKNITVVLNTWVFSDNTISQLIDYRSKSKASHFLGTVNELFYDLAISDSGIICFDTTLFLQESTVSLRDNRLAFYAGMGFHSSLLNKIAAEFVTIVKTVLGLSKKVLVLDLDNTLWGGVLGDDGYQNIVLGGEYEGAAYENFQKIIKQLASQGVILAINSKNNREAVDAVFSLHPDMVLAVTDFSCIKANWKPKYENMVDIQSALNISTDSFVFVDDSLFECESIRTIFPDIVTVPLTDDVILFTEKFMLAGFFNKMAVTLEDRDRSKNYLVQNKRKQLAKKINCHQDFLAELGIAVTIFMPDSIEVDRIAQLTTRTNQFNLSGSRFSSEEIHQKIKNKDWFVFGITYEDKFGKDGIISAVFLENNIKVLVIRNIVLSCRAFGRGIEELLMQWIIDYGQKNGVSEIRGIYIPTDKNQVSACFYEKNGFLRSGVEEGVYSKKINTETVANFPEWIKLHVSTK